MESSSCRTGFLQIHDGESPSAHMLGKYCGSSHPEMLLSSHNSLYFWFYSDRRINDGGFTVHWASQQPGKTMLPAKPNKNGQELICSLKACGWVQTWFGLNHGCELIPRFEFLDGQTVHNRQMSHVCLLVFCMGSGFSYVNSRPVPRLKLHLEPDQWLQLWFLSVLWIQI